MPLNEHLPVIDDRRYSDILEELRTRIPRYTPEWRGWTDLNDSDPGITLAQLMAWLTEMMIHRMGKVPELNYLKFLELLGIELRPAQAAAAEIEFAVQESHDKPFVIVPWRTQVSAEDEEGGAPIVFETDRAIHALAAQLKSVQAFDGFAYREAIEHNTALQPYLPFGHAPREGAALYLGFNYPENYAGVKEFPRVELDLAVTVSGRNSQGPTMVQCGGVQSRVFPSATLFWEAWNGGHWQKLDVIKDETLALTRSGHVVLQTPPAGVMKLVKVGEVGAEQEGYFVRVRVVRSGYERAPELLAVRTNTARATQAETVAEEVLGGSNGRREQLFALANRPVLTDSLQLEIDEGDGFKRWTRVDDFFSSNADDTHYVLNPSTGEVRLGGVRIGDGLHGHVPVANVRNAGANVVAREYRFGGGKRGNLKAGTLTTLITTIEGIDDAKVANPFDAHSGRDEETIEEARIRASRSIRSRSRAVTRDDFEQIAQEAGNVKRAKALPLFHPNFPDTEIPGVISVIIVPDSDAAQPKPSDGMMRSVCAYLNERRLLTAEVYVLAPTYQRVEVRGEVIVNDDADLSEAKQKVEETLSAYFHPLTGGDDGKGWPFGGAIFYSKVVHRVFAVPGVARIQQLDIYVDGEKKEKCEDVEIQTHGLTYSTEHHVDVAYASVEEPA
jgi:predicted phage baseplate assembly protein